MSADEDVDRYIFGRGGRAPLFPGDLFHDIDPDRSADAYGLGEAVAVLDALELIRQAVARDEVSVDDVRRAVAPIAEASPLHDDDTPGHERERFE